MGKSHTVKTELGEFTAKELTVGQVRDVLDEVGKGHPHIIDILFAEENVPAAAIAISTGLPADSEKDVSLMSFSAGDMLKIIQAVKEVNPDFLGLAERIKAALPALIPKAILTDVSQPLSE